jgi:hypothetical protein
LQKSEYQADAAAIVSQRALVACCLKEEKPGSKQEAGFSDQVAEGFSSGN